MEEEKNSRTGRSANRTKQLTEGGMIAAFYVVLTLISSLMGLAGGPVQIRLSEALCVLPAFTPAAVPGLFAGCLLANLLTGCPAADVIVGSLTTLAGAWCTRMLAGRFPDRPVLLPLPPILLNAAVLPLLLIHVYGYAIPWPALFGSILLGEGISCGVLGMLLYRLIKKEIFRVK